MKRLSAGLGAADRNRQRGGERNGQRSRDRPRQRAPPQWATTAAVAGVVAPRVRRLRSGAQSQSAPRRCRAGAASDRARGSAAAARGAAAASPAGSADQSMSCRSTAASVVRDVFARRTRAARSASRRARRRTPRCRRACRRLCPSPAPAPCRRPCRESRPAASARGGERRRVHRVRRRRRATGSIALARPKSSTFTVPSARTLMFAGFRSRWTMPCSCAASSASAICLAIGSASSSGIGAARDALDEVLALDELHHERARRRRPPRARRSCAMFG